MSKRSLLAVAWTFVVLVLCLMPGRWLPEHPTQPGSFHLPHTDKVVHFGMFALFGLLWSRACVTRDRTGAILAAGLFLAVATELAQGIPFIDRDPDALDALADAVGVLAGLATHRWLIGRPHRR